MNISRRAFAGVLSILTVRAEPTSPLDREVGITTSSLSGHAGSAAGQFALLDLPRVVRDELDMRVIDLNTATLGSLDAAHLDRFREAAAKAGTVLTNLKMNQRDLDMDSADPAVRRHALAGYKLTIDAAARLGCRWARPLPRPARPDLAIHIASYRELAGYAASRGVRMLVENFGWMESDEDAIPAVVTGAAMNTAACPDTGNWSANEVRYKGLAKAFPLAVTCDFKTRKLGPGGEHPEYNLKRCFEMGWRAGFKGPWCLEFADRDRSALFRQLGLVRDLLRTWMKEPG